MPKLTVEFGEVSNKLLEQLAAKHGTTKVAILRLAVGLLSYVDEETSKDPKRRHLAITEDDKVIKEFVI